VNAARRHPTSVIVLWAATGVLCVITLFAAGSRATDVLTARYGSGLSAGDRERLSVLSALFKWERTSPRYQDAGLGEAVPNAVFGTLFLYAAARAFLGVRRRDFIAHREWMLRVFALAVGVGTIRVAVVGLLALGMGLREVIGPSFALGWVSTLLVAEWWVRRTRSGNVGNTWVSR
jgi:hypothetical protein